MSRQDDIRLLKKALLKLDDASEEERKVIFAKDAFQDMLERLEAAASPGLSRRQREWVSTVLDEPGEYENLISTGKAPRGREVPTPAVLRNLPLKPPGRT